MDQVIVAAHICFFAPLVGSLLSWFCQYLVLDDYAHAVAITGVALAWLASMFLAFAFVVEARPAVDYVLYTWLAIPGYTVQIGYVLDALSTSMLTVVSGVSLMVYIYSVGYMAYEQGYARFFAWMSLFSFMMINLVIARDVVQLFAGWEGVGLVSYWLIGFYYKKPSAADGGLKAFLLNRVGDMGFILGIAATYYVFSSTEVGFITAQSPAMVDKLILGYPALSVIALSWFIGAMGKSAQIPLHLWLPESMEGPTPISALIHAATMVTAGVYMMCRFAPLYEQCLWVSNIIVLVGASGALWLGLVGLVQMDIKRVIAFSTLSQLGYMVAAVGAGAYGVAMLHLITHACFKALLFLAAGSVIHALLHQQDLSKMGQLQRHLPLTGLLFLIGALSLSAIPPFSGFFSKDAIIEAVIFQQGQLYGGSYAVGCLLLGAMVTPMYIFRVFWLVFYAERTTYAFDDEVVVESPPTMLAPMVALAFPSAAVGYSLSERLGYNLLFHNSIPLQTAYATEVTQHVYSELSHPLAMMEHSLFKLPLYLSLLGLGLSWWWYQCLGPVQRQRYYDNMGLVLWVLERQYGLGYVLEHVITPTFLWVANSAFYWGDRWLLNGLSNRVIAGSTMRCAKLFRTTQTGYISHYLMYIAVGLLFTALLVGYRLAGLGVLL